MGYKVRQIDEYICAEMIKSDIELNYENFYKDDLIRLLKECRKEYKKLQSKLKIKEEVIKKFEKYLNDCVSELENNYGTSSIQNAINTGIVDITKVILSKFNEILSKGENK